MVKRIVSPCSIYVVLWLLVILNPTLSILPDSLSVMLLSLLFAWSLIYVVKSFLQKRAPKYIIALNILFILFSIYGFIRIANGETYYIWISSNNTPVGPREFLISYWRSILPVYAFIHFTKKGYLSTRGLVGWTFIFLLIAIINYYGEESQRIAMIPIGTLQDGVTNNQGYAILSLLPLIAFFRKKPLVQYILYGVVLVFTVMSYKRGAMLIAFISILSGIILFRNKTTSFRFFTGAILASAIIFVAYYFVNWNIENSSYFLMKLEDSLSGDNSGRDIIYSQLVDYLINQLSLFKILFGSGADATFKLIGEAAHNDWLEIAVDMGAFGLVAYLFYYICFLRMVIDSKSFGNEIHQCVYYLFVICFFRSLFSMSINEMSLYLTMALGYSVSVMYYKTTIKIEN